MALLLRVWALDVSPPGLDADEVSLGYNAYSLLRTGRDEYGQPWPLTFRAFGEYKRPAYVYAAIPGLAVWGPTPVGVRMAAAVAGTLSVPALYAVTALLLRNWRAALGAAALLVLSPWHLHFTRAAREASLLVLAILLLAGALLRAWHTPAFRSCQGRGGVLPGGAGPWYVGAAGAFLLAVYSYPGGLLFAPLLVLVLAGAYAGRVRRGPWGWIGAAVALAALGLVPLAAQFADGRAQVRLSQASIFNVSAVRQIADARVARDRRDGAPWVLNAPTMVALRQAVNAYLAHFDPTYLFTRGDPEWRHHSSDAAQLHLWDLPLLGAGLVKLVRGWRRPALRAIGAWLVIGPLPAAFAENAPHAVRSIVMLPAWYLLAAIGLAPVWRWLRRRGYERDWLLLLGLSLAFYLYTLYRYYPVEHATSWQSGMLEGYRAARAEVDAGRFERVVIPQEMSASYIYALFGTAYDPQSYLLQGGSVVDPAGSFFPYPGPLRFRPFEVRVVDWGSEPRRPEALYVLEASNRLPPGLRVVKVIRDAGGQDKLQLVAFPAAP